MNTQEKQLTVSNSKGIHGRIAAGMIKLATRHKVRLCIIHDNQLVDCASVLDILSIALVQGSTFRIRIEGQESERALAAMEKLINGNDETSREEEKSARPVD